MSLAAYALVAFRRRGAAAVEAGFKYLIMGSVGTIVLLIGISFVYRSRGHLALPPIPGLARRISRGTYARLGLACVMVGLAVKSAIVPLHTWLPDAHGRAPSSISALLSGIVIQSTFYVGLKVSLGLGFPRRSLGTVLILLSLLNMTLGNGMALVQDSAKRLLAYSTIAQMGYVMLSIGIGMRYRSSLAIQAGFLLLLAHAVMKGLAFLSKGTCNFYDGADTVTQLRGTSRRLPLVAGTFALSLAGLVGVPPLAGFSAKWFMLLQALRAATTRVPVRPPPALIYVGLAFFALNSLVSLGYFLPLIGALFSPPIEPQDAIKGRRRISFWMAFPLVVLAALVIAIGVYPGPWLQWMAGISEYLMRT
jgi:formate hydrogenlyase subunit 3/multisubunit Na+/H+ antiporter MnhD subunit